MYITWALKAKHNSKPEETECLQLFSVQVLESHCWKPPDFVHLVVVCLSIPALQRAGCNISYAQQKGWMDRGSCQSATCKRPGSGRGQVKVLLISLILQTSSLSCSPRVGDTVPSGQGPHATKIPFPLRLFLSLINDYSPPPSKWSLDWTILLFLIYRTVFNIMFYKSYVHFTVWLSGFVLKVVSAILGRNINDNIHRSGSCPPAKQAVKKTRHCRQPTETACVWQRLYTKINGTTNHSKPK